MQSNAEVISKTGKFEEMALVHMDSVHRYALYMTKNESDANDLVQEAYLRAYRFFAKFREGTNCKAWLMAILRNTFINTIRRKKRHPQMVCISKISEQEIDLSDHANPEDAIFGSLLGDDVTAAVDSLPTEYRTAVLLADIQGFSYKEIAERVGCPLGTVMSRLCRGRRLLKKSLQDYAVRHGFS